MRHKADRLGVDLLLVDTGDLHDGAGLSDATSLNGVLSNPIFENIDYDVLTIGNHELYVTDIAYEHFYNFSRYWGDKYVTSNVQIHNPNSNKFEFIGKQYRYFTTPNSLRIMTFGVLFDFNGNSNASNVILANETVASRWWQDAVMGKPQNETKPLPIDLFLLIGHNPVRWNDSESTFETYYKSIRGLQPHIPIQVFGGHLHIRDFAVYDEMTTALESGRYCETMGFFSMSGIQSPNYTGVMAPTGVPHPKQLALSSSMTNNPNATDKAASLQYFRRYLDWNRLTFEYHASGSQSGNSTTFDSYHGERVTENITATRKELNISTVIGCAPQTWCLSCAPYGSSDNIFSGLVPDALKVAVVSPTRKNVPRITIVNSGGIRFDLTQGPFTIDDSYIVSPFNDLFVYIPNVPYKYASKVLNVLNTDPAYQKRDLSIDAADDLHKRELSTRDFSFEAFQPVRRDDCKTPSVGAMSKRSTQKGPIRKRAVSLTPGYTTADDFGSDGDDTLHSHIPDYVNSIPSYIGTKGSLPANPSDKLAVDLIFIDYIETDVLPILSSLGANYSVSDIQYYINSHYSTNTYLNDYARIAWQANITHCPVGIGPGGDMGT